MNNNAFQNNNPSNNQNSGDSAGINVFFRASGERAKTEGPIMIQCRLEEKVSDIIQRYRNKVGDRGQEKKFIFNAKNLSPSLSLAEAGINNNANIFVVETKGIKGA